MPAARDEGGQTPASPSKARQPAGGLGLWPADREENNAMRVSTSETKTYRPLMGGNTETMGGINPNQLLPEARGIHLFQA